MYILKRDGKEVTRGTWLQCCRYIHERHCFSLEWAMKYEGYSMEPVQ